MSEIASAVEGTIGDLFGDQTEDAPVGEAAVQETEVEAVSELPDWDAASRDLFTEDEDEEPDFSVEEDETTPEAFVASEYDDEETSKLKREALAARKQAEHYQRLHLKTSRKNWETDVRSQPWGEFLPADLSTIKASSHRDFLKQAKSVAKSNYTVLKPHYEKLQAERTKLVELARQEAEKDVQAAWGRPTVGSGRVPATQNQAQTDIDQKTESALTDARRDRSMFKAVKAMIEGDVI